jgi:predicted metalloprotease
MKWEGIGSSGRVEDRRGMRPVAVGGGIGALILAAVVYFLTGDPEAAKQAAQQGGRQKVEQVGPPPDDRTKKFVDTILFTTDEVWKEQFGRNGYRQYEEPGLVLFSIGVETKGCGNAPSEVGPFYCPADRTVYLDPTFFKELEQKLGGSSAEFSQAYVIAHEVGHHVQNQLGYNDRVRQYERREGKNATIRLELQADYLAGVWAHHGQKRFNFLESGDLDKAITTARAIGDDRIMKKAGRWPSPESFTHGTAEQRVKYFKQGFQSGDASKRVLDRFFDPDVDPLKL